MEEQKTKYCENQKGRACLCFLLPLLLIIGCTPISRHNIVYPSDTPYFEGNDLFDNQNYDDAITLYAQYLKDKPHSKYAVPAALNLGMSYYYTENYTDAYTTLHELKIEDENIKAYVANIINTCKVKGGEEVTKLAQATASAAARPGQTANGIQIAVKDAYLDGFGSVVLMGITSSKASIAVNGTRTATNDKNVFTVSVSWKRGQPIMITAKDKSGRTGELNYFPDQEVPEEPENLSVINMSSNSLEVEWDGNTEDDIVGYKFYYRSNRSALKEERELIKAKRFEIVGLSRLVTDSDRTIKVFLRAVDKMGNESEPSDTLEVELPL